MLTSGKISFGAFAIGYPPTYHHATEEDHVEDDLGLGCRSDWDESLVCSLFKWHLYLFEMLNVFHMLINVSHNFSL